jgi:hypothetical protein
MSTALDYLDYVPGEASTAVAVLKDRIYRSGGAAAAGGVPAGMHAPPFPFILEDVRPQVGFGACMRACEHAWHHACMRACCVHACVLCACVLRACMLCACVRGPLASIYCFLFIKSTTSIL